METKIGILKLIKDDRPTCVGLIRCIKNWKSLITPEEDFANVGDISFGKNSSKQIFECWEPVKPIILCNDEIKVGSQIACFNAFGRLMEISTCTKILNETLETDGTEYDGKWVIKNCKKVLVTPEQVKEDFIKYLVARKVLNGDLLVEVVLEYKGRRLYNQEQEVDKWSPLIVDNKAIIHLYKDTKNFSFEEVKKAILAGVEHGKSIMAYYQMNGYGTAPLTPEAFAAKYLEKNV